MPAWRRSRKGTRRSRACWTLSQVRSQNVAAQIWRSGARRVKYPAVNVYCEKIVNDLTEKFQTFSGTCRWRSRCGIPRTGWRGCRTTLELYADAAMQVLDASRGRLGRRDVLRRRVRGGVRAVKQGGKNFIQVAKVTFRDRSEQELVCPHIFPPTQTGSTRRWRARTGRWQRSRPRNRIPAVKLTVQQQLDDGGRGKDKTGSRTFAGVPAGGRRRTNFELRTYLTSWDKTTAGPGYGPLFQAAMGGTPVRFAGGTVASSTAAGRLGFGAPHGLAAGQAVSFGRRDPVRGGDRGCADGATERAVHGVAGGGRDGRGDGDITAGDGTAEREHLRLLGPGDGGAETAERSGGGPDGHRGERRLPRVPLQRHGAGRGGQRSFAAGAAQLQSFPAEPRWARSITRSCRGTWDRRGWGRRRRSSSRSRRDDHGEERAGHADAGVRDRAVPAGAIAPGERTVTAAFDLYRWTTTPRTALYQAARQQSPISVMFQLGETDGQMMGVYLKSVVPEVPEFDDEQEPAAVAVPVIAGAGDGGRRNCGGVRISGRRTLEATKARRW